MAQPCHPSSVLLVEDDEDTRELYSEFLRYSGVRVWTAESTPSALSSARDHHPDVVVTDISLPGEDGWTLCRLLKADAATRTCAVIALTGWVHDRQITARAQQSGVDLVLTKPCLPDALLAGIDGLRRKGALLRARGQKSIARAEALRGRSARLVAGANRVQKRIRRNGGK